MPWRSVPLHPGERSRPATRSAIEEAVQGMRKDGHDVSHVHIRHLWPLPRNLGELLHGFDRIMVPEINNGQLVTLLRAQYLVPAEGVNQINGLPFRVSDLTREMLSRLEDWHKPREGDMVHVKDPDEYKRILLYYRSGAPLPE